MYFPATSAGPRRAPSYMGQPGFSDLTAYVQRMSYLMAMGRPDATVALYLPSMSMWLGSDKSDEQFVSAERLLSEHQIDFDIVDENALASGLKSLPGAFETLSGNRYRTVILPAPLVLPAAAEMRLKAFARSGGKVVFLGGAPEWIAGRTIRDARAATAAEFSWASVLSAQLPPTPTPPAEPPAAPPAPQMVPAEVLAALQSAVIAPVVAMDAPDTALRVMKRRWKDADVYLFFNEGATASQHAVTLMASGRVEMGQKQVGHTVEAWDAQTGSVTPLDATRSGGHAVIQLDLEPYAARVIVVR